MTYKLPLTLLFYLVTLGQTAESAIFGVMNPCPKNETNIDTCKLCISVSDQRPPNTARFLYKYLKSVRVGGSYDNFTWSYAQVNGVDPDKINITLFAWSHSNPDFGHPIPGCCNVPLKKGGCLATKCREGRVFFGLTTEKLHAAYTRRPWGKIDNCTKQPKKMNFIYTCPLVLPEWMQKRNAKCLRYDPNTGDHVLTNSSKKWESVSWTDWMEDRRNQIARELTQMCTFLLPKERVLAESDPSVSLSLSDQILFQREVFHMSSLRWTGQSVTDLQNNTIQCQIKAINFSEILQLQHINFDQNMYMCVVLWSGKSSSNEGGVLPVKCMAQNDSETTVSTSKPTTGGSNDTLTFILISLFGGLFAFLVVVLLCLLLKRKVRKFIKKTEKVPEYLNQVMKQEKNVYATNESSKEGSKDDETSPFEPLAPNMYRSFSVHT